MSIDAKQYNAMRESVEKELDIGWLAFKYIIEKAKGGRLTVIDIEQAEKIIGGSHDLCKDLLLSLDEIELNKHKDE